MTKVSFNSPAHDWKVLSDTVAIVVVVGGGLVGFVGGTVVSWIV
jgi:hypothetical protein